jgi:DNA-binding MarR family transcriptional regulator
MHKAFFGIKRVHLRVLAVSRALLGRVALTPARFDLMRIVELHTEGIPQRNIQYLLGVSAPTISRMVKALEKLGMLRRRRWEQDRRCVLVEMTHVGAGVVGAARESLVESGVAERFALRGLGSDPDTARTDLTTLQRFLMRMRRAFHDSPLFEHPWRVGCIDEPYAFHTIVDGRLTLTTAPL